MKREKEFNEIKKCIKEYYDNGNCGFFNTMNIVGDPMLTIFDGKYFTLDICYFYSYFEIFGTTDDEFKELKKFYNSLEGDKE